MSHQDYNDSGTKPSAARRKIDEQSGEFEKPLYA